MKKIFLAVALSALAGSNFVNLVQADAKVRKELAAVYAKVDAAVKAKDLKALESLLADDYEGRSDGKKMNKAETIARMKQHFEMVKEFTSSKTKIDKIQHLEGNEIVDYTQTIKGTVAGPNGKDVPLDVSVKGRDWWVKNDDGKWICVAGEETGSEVRVDGKPMTE
ncbi:MAG: nuclear transport factor 2 family protein [Acidobacteriota bacterium]|nr:nuclear transport factor 2 family protein [Acidobacteriota bacterium]